MWNGKNWVRLGVVTGFLDFREVMWVMRVFRYLHLGPAIQRGLAQGMQYSHFP